MEYKYLYNVLRSQDINGSPINLIVMYCPCFIVSNRGHTKVENITHIIPRLSTDALLPTQHNISI